MNADACRTLQLVARLHSSAQDVSSRGASGSPGRGPFAVFCAAAVVALTVASVGRGATYNWIGMQTPGITNWSDAANWNPNTGVPGANDIALFDKNSTQVSVFAIQVTKVSPIGAISFAPGGPSANIKSVYNFYGDFTTGRLNLTNGGTITNNTGQGQSIASAIQLLSNNNTYAATLTDNDVNGDGKSYVQVSGEISTDGKKATGNLVVNGTGKVFIGAGSALTDSPGNGSVLGLVKNGTGELVLTTGTNTFSGGTSIVGGTVSFLSGALGTKPSQTISFAGSSTLHFLTGNNQDVSSQIKIANGAIATIDTDVNGDPRTAPYNDPKSPFYAPPITFATGLTGGGLLNKSGSGTLILNAANTYTGATTVSAGTLVVNKPIASMITVNSGATLKGTGPVKNNVIVNKGGTWAPGNSPGSQTADLAAWNGGGIYQWELNQVSSGGRQDSLQGFDPGFDFIGVNGELAINATATDPFIIQITSLDLTDASGGVDNWNPNGSYSWVIATAGQLTLDGADPLASRFMLDTSNFQNPISGREFSIEQQGNNLVLDYNTIAAVPEPSTLALIGLGVCGLMAHSWRGRRRPEQG